MNGSLKSVLSAHLWNPCELMWSVKLASSIYFKMTVPYILWLCGYGFVGRVYWTLMGCSISTLMIGAISMPTMKTSFFVPPLTITWSLAKVYPGSITLNPQNYQRSMSKLFEVKTDVFTSKTQFCVHFSNFFFTSIECHD